MQNYQERSIKPLRKKIKDEEQEQLNNQINRLCQEGKQLQTGNNKRKRQFRPNVKSNSSQSQIIVQKKITKAQIYNEDRPITGNKNGYSSIQDNQSMKGRDKKANQSFIDDRPIKGNKNVYKFDQSQIDYPKNKEFQSNNAGQLNRKRGISKVSQSSNNQYEQRSIKPVQSSSMSYDQFQMQNSENVNIELEQCPQGCGRKFNPQALQKHIKVCQKVFQKKRKPFKVEVVDDEAKQVAQKNVGKMEEKQSKKNQKIPKWKKQSEMLRKGLKVNKQDGSSTSIPVQESDDRIECGGCGRKFNEKAAQKHIPSCIQRKKQKK